MLYGKSAFALIEDWFFHRSADFHLSQGYTHYRRANYPKETAQ